jgi:hypothetical protein
MTTKATKSRQGPRCTELAGIPAGLLGMFGAPFMAGASPPSMGGLTGELMGGLMGGPTGCSGGGVLGSSGGRFDAGFSD